MLHCIYLPANQPVFHAILHAYMILLICSISTSQLVNLSASHPQTSTYVYLLCVYQSACQPVHCSSKHCHSYIYMLCVNQSACQPVYWSSTHYYLCQPVSLSTCLLVVNTLLLMYMLFVNQSACQPVY